MIPQPDVKMTDISVPVLYPSSSMGSIYSNSLGVSYCASFEPSSKHTLVSTSVDATSTSHLYHPSGNVYVNLVSHEDASGSSSSSCGPSSSCPPIFHSNEDIMEAMTTLDYPWDNMHHCMHLFS